jgi:ubiquinone/menaquinone biosynthesis C-methylase UbiE
MGKEIDLLANYPKAKRDPSARAAEKTAEDIAVARRFGPEFFDGERRYGYGGYTYTRARWRGVVEDILREYGPFSSVLDVGCAKGHMLWELKQAMPRIDVEGVDISEYAVANGQPEIRDSLSVGNATALRYPAHSFDLVISINTVHNLGRRDCIKALQEIMRVTRRDAYVTVDSYRTEDERKRMHDWNLTAKTILHTDEWIELFDEAGYTGDYGWFLP